MATTVIPAKPKAVIMARVFRSRQDKPRFIPKFLWQIAKRNRWPGTGRWDNHGVIASTAQGNVEII